MVYILHLLITVLSSLANLPGNKLLKQAGKSLEKTRRIERVKTLSRQIGLKPKSVEGKVLVAVKLFDKKLDLGSLKEKLQRKENPDGKDNCWFV